MGRGEKMNINNDAELVFYNGAEILEGPCWDKNNNLLYFVSIKADTQMNILTPTLVMDVTNQTNLTTPTFVSVNKDSFNVKSPNINLDAREGGAVIKSKAQTIEI